jgi:hypothetical protein
MSPLRYKMTKILYIYISHFLFYGVCFIILSYGRKEDVAKNYKKKFAASFIFSNFFFIFFSIYMDIFVTV